MNIAKFSANNSVLVNLMMVGLFIFGGISLWQMPTELNPKLILTGYLLPSFTPVLRLQKPRI